MSRNPQDFQTIHSEGGLLPPDLLRRVLDPKEKIPGTQPEDYGLPRGERINETITQSWNRLRRHWAEFRAAAANLPEGEAGTGLTNDKWSVPLLRELGFGLLPTIRSPEINGRSYAINRFFGQTAIHLVGCGLSLDRRAAGVRGAAIVNPHGLVQEFLNRSGSHIWGIVSNGLRFRVLRDNQALSRQSYLEFDLEAMFVGEVYSDFVLLWLTAHATRFAPREGDRLESCWLEQWIKLADEQGTRALGDLRGGVEKALQILGQGFAGHTRNTALREALRTGTLSLNDFHGQLLRVVYRLIFLFVAEDRTLDGVSLLHPRDESEQGRISRERYAAYYGTARLREMASRIKGSRHCDLWQQFNLLVGALAGEERFDAARNQLALPILGSFLWSPASTTMLNASSLTGGEGTELANADFLEALRDLAFTRQDKVLRPVDYKNLGSEELGGVYESLLALTPQISGDGTRFTFAEFSGNVRKTSGSYYTPDSLVQCLLDSALDPVVEEAIKDKTSAEAEKAILSLKICDPAVGSGHFLVGTAHRLARHLARVRALAQGESEPSPLLYQHALRDVIGHCLYGVDINPMSAELCRVSLWLEALEPGKPLSFLDHHIRVGNSLLGATPELIAGGIPDDAFAPIEGDDKKACAVLKKRNKVERKGLGQLFAQQDAEIQERLQQTAAALEQLPDDRPEDIRCKESAFRQYEQTEESRRKTLLADSWCAAFVIRKYLCEPGLERSAIGLTQRHLNDIAGGTVSAGDQPLINEVHRLAATYRFFHWHLAFPEVSTKGGFDCVLGNPPWDQIQLDPEEFFAWSAPEIVSAQNMAARMKAIKELQYSNPSLYENYVGAQRYNDCVKKFIHASGLFPHTSYGRLNTAPLFAELSRSKITPRGRIGLIVPTGIATDSFNQFFFQDIISSNCLVSLYSFENEEFVFPAVHHATKFCLLTLGGLEAPTMEPDFVFYARQVHHLAEPERYFSLSVADIGLLNPNTRTCPIFRTSHDAELTKAIYHRISVFVEESKDDEGNPWGFHGLLMFMMNTDSHLFRTREELESNGYVLNGNVYRNGSDNYLPLYEAKMVFQFDHRFGTYEGQTEAQANQGKLPELDETAHANPHSLPLPRYWVCNKNVMERIEGKWDRQWFLGWRDITSAVSTRTVIACIVPCAACPGEFTLSFTSCSAGHNACLLGEWNSFVHDFVARQKIGGTHLKTFSVKQLPDIPPITYGQYCQWTGNTAPLKDWLLPRVLELTYTAWDLEPFAQDCGWRGPPFRWSEERRFLLRCELDAIFFHLYLGAADEWRQQPEALTKAFPTPRHALDYIMDTFPIVKRRDEEKHGEYRTKRVILEIYDALAEAQRTCQPYQTRLDPPPADPNCCHPPRPTS